MEMGWAMKKMVSGALVAALLVTSGTPALAAAPIGAGGWELPAASQWGGDRHWRGDRWRGDRRWRRHHRRGSDAGAVLAGAAVVGALALLIGSANKSKRDRDGDARDNVPPPSRPGYPDNSYPGDRGNSGGSGSSAIQTENDAADACASAAEREAERIGTNPGVRSVDSVDGSGREWRVSGTVEAGGDNRTQAAAYRFTCSVRYGQVERVDIEDGALASR